MGERDAKTQKGMQKLKKKKKWGAKKIKDCVIRTPWWRAGGGWESGAAFQIRDPNSGGNDDDDFLY